MNNASFSLIRRIDLASTLTLEGRSVRLVKRSSGTFQILENNCIKFETFDASYAEKLFQEVAQALRDRDFR